MATRSKPKADPKPKPENTPTLRTVGKGLSRAEQRRIGREALEAAIRANEARGPIRPYSREAMMAVCELVAQGHLVRDIEQIEGMPSSRDVTAWLLVEREAQVMMDEARRQSAFAMEEEVIGALRTAAERGVTPTDLRTLAELAQQGRWSAEKRHPKAYGPRPPASIVVPIQINTTLDLGTGEAQIGTDEHPDIWALGNAEESRARLEKQERRKESLIAMGPMRRTAEDARELVELLALEQPKAEAEAAKVFKLEAKDVTGEAVTDPETVVKPKGRKAKAAA